MVVARDVRAGAWRWKACVCAERCVGDRALDAGLGCAGDCAAGKVGVRRSGERQGGALGGAAYVQSGGDERLVRHTRDLLLAGRSKVQPLTTATAPPDP